MTPGSEVIFEMLLKTFALPKQAAFNCWNLVMFVEKNMAYAA